MFVKICGITRLDDALLAADLGAAAVGFVMWKGSRRFIEPAKARAIVERLPSGVVPVGVFVDEDAGVVNAVADGVGLGAVQLHGGESAEYCALILRPIIRALALTDERRLAEVPARATVLLDAADPQRHGGTGTTIDWGAAARFARRRPTILAGGLDPRNVGAAIDQVAPYGVDVSSGVEIAPGIKDGALLRAFFAAVTAVGR